MVGQAWEDHGLCYIGTTYRNFPEQAQAFVASPDKLFSTEVLKN